MSLKSRTSLLVHLEFARARQQGVVEYVDAVEVLAETECGRVELAQSGALGQRGQVLLVRHLRLALRIQLVLVAFCHSYVVVSLFRPPFFSYSSERSIDSACCSFLLFLLINRKSQERCK